MANKRRVALCMSKDGEGEMGEGKRGTERGVGRCTL